MAYTADYGEIEHFLNVQQATRVGHLRQRLLAIF